jgi:type IV secretion system protein VirB9
LDAARGAAAKTIERARQRIPCGVSDSIAVPYRFKANQRPFNVSAIYTDGKFTYIRADANELTCARYELVDGWPSHVKSPNLVNFQVEHGVYIVPKVVESGYLVIGKQKLVFEAVR